MGSAKEGLRLAGVVRDSIVDGPGIRYVVFVQGCPHHCEGCHNPQSHDFQGGFDCTLERLQEDIQKNKLLQGVTFSGGEPFCQAAPLAGLGRWVKQQGLDLYVYTGYTFEQLLDKNDKGIQDLLSVCDCLVDGPFLLEQKNLLLRFRGSGNQRILDVSKSLAAGKAIEANLPE